MLKQILLTVVTVAALTSAYLLYTSRKSAVQIIKDESVLEIPVTTTQVAPGQQVQS